MCYSAHLSIDVHRSKSAKNFSFASTAVNALTCKCISSGKSIDPCTASCLQENVSGVNAGKGCVQEDSNPVKGRPKRSGDKNMGGLLTIQGPKSSG